MKKTCLDCGKSYVARSNRAKVCPSCRMKRDSAIKREWERKPQNALQHRIRTQRNRAIALGDVEAAQTWTYQAAMDALDMLGGDRCVLTGATEDVTLDHVIPLKYGGRTAIGNMIPIARGLNASKGNANIFDWFRDNGERLGIHRVKFAHMIGLLALINKMSAAEYVEYVYSHFTADEAANE